MDKKENGSGRPRKKAKATELQPKQQLSDDIKKEGKQQMDLTAEEEIMQIVMKESTAAAEAKHEVFDDLLLSPPPGCLLCLLHQWTAKQISVLQKALADQPAGFTEHRHDNKCNHYHSDDVLIASRLRASGQLSSLIHVAALILSNEQAREADKLEQLASPVRDMKPLLDHLEADHRQLMQSFVAQMDALIEAVM